MIDRPRALSRARNEAAVRQTPLTRGRLSRVNRQRVNLDADDRCLRVFTRQPEAEEADAAVEVGDGAGLVWRGERGDSRQEFRQQAEVRLEK